jgi:ketosteroid isomerase-like protein
MTKIMRSKDCGNSPKNKFIENLEISIATGDVEFLLASVTDDVHWNIAGGKPVRGKDALAEAIRNNSEVTKITINHVVSHGRAGSVNGARKHRNGKTYDFCSVYEFSNAKGTSVREITSYIIARA